MLYELRVYHICPGKMANINKRFSEHTLELFKRHGIHVCDFWQDVSGEEKIYYICAFKDRETRDAAFEAFRVDPEWVQVKSDSIQGGEIVDHVESFFMERVPYINVDWPASL